MANAGGNLSFTGELNNDSDRHEAEKHEVPITTPQFIIKLLARLRVMRKDALLLQFSVASQSKSLKTQ